MASDASLYVQPGICEQLGCRESTVEVALPAGVWAGHPGGVQISIGWVPNDNNDRDLDLYVYGPDGSLAGGRTALPPPSRRSASAMPSTAGTGWWSFPSSFIGTLDYRGFAEVERDPAADPARPLLPNLMTLPIRNPKLRTGAYVIDHGQAGTPSCYPEEMAERGARRCLRFDQMLANVGEGPFELRYRMEGLAPTSSSASGSTPATARSAISRSTPTSSTRPTPTSTTRTSARRSSTGSIPTAPWTRSGRAARTGSA